MQPGNRAPTLTQVRENFATPESVPFWDLPVYIGSAERVAQGGSAGRSQAVMLLVYPLALLPVGLAYGARYAFRMEIAFYALLAFAAAVGAVVYWLALDSAGAAAERRKEQIITELSRGDGPVATE